MFSLKCILAFFGGCQLFCFYVFISGGEVNFNGGEGAADDIFAAIFVCSFLVCGLFSIASLIANMTVSMYEDE